MSDCCETCRYWLEHRKAASRGSCRRYPPPDSCESAFPWVYAEMWCGEYRARAEAVAPMTHDECAAIGVKWLEIEP